MTSQQSICSAIPENKGRELGRKLRESRKNLGLKQKEFARILGIPRSVVSELENGMWKSIERSLAKS